MKKVIMAKENNVEMIDFNNFEKRYSLRRIEDENQIMLVAQEKGVLVIAYKFDKQLDMVIELEGKLGDELKKNIPKEEHKTRIDDYVKYAFEAYHPDSRTNQNNSSSNFEG